MRKSSEYLPYICVAIFLILYISVLMIIDNDLFKILLLLLLFVFPTFLALKYNGKHYYFHSKSIGGGKNFLNFFFLLPMIPVYFFAFAAFLFRSLLPFEYVSLIILLLLILSSPGIYLASKKNFLIFLNKRMNSFLIRFFFLIPGAFTFSVGFALLSFLLYIIVLMILALMFTLYLSELNKIGIHGLIALSIIGSLLTIFFFKKYYLKDDMPPEYQTNLMEHELYVFMPAGTKINDQASYNSSIGIRTQVRNLQVFSKKSMPDFALFRIYSPQFLETTLDHETLNKNDILFTRHGALIVSNKVLEIFEKNNLTGYQLRNILDEKTKNTLSTHFQLVSISEMFQMSSQTKIKKSFFGNFLIPDDKIYYEPVVLNYVSDFNKTIEYIGTNQGMPYYHQKLWIVSHKAMNILINQLGQTKRDFIPVMLVDDEKKD